MVNFSPFYNNSPLNTYYFTEILAHMKSNCVKFVRIRSCSGPYFPAFGLNTERYGVEDIQSKYRKIRTRITPNTGTFYPVNVYQRNTGL